MANTKYQVKVTVAWWLKWYLAGGILTARLTKMQPDQAKLEHWIKRAVTIRFE